MPSSEADISATIRALRECFQCLKAYGDEVHAALGVNASMRGVLESLDEGGPLTVPQIARLKGVSRQHIQLVVNALAKHGHAAIAANPQDARSPVVEITKTGRALYRKIVARELTILLALAEQFPPTDLAITRRTLDEIKSALEGLSTARSNSNA